MPGHLIRRLSQQSNQVFQDEMKRIGFDVTSVQFAAMQAIDLHGEMEQSQIAQSIHYDKATIGGVIDRLEKRGWVERKANPKDKRAKLVSLTKEGCKALGSLRQWSMRYRIKLWLILVLKSVHCLSNWRKRLFLRIFLILKIALFGVGSVPCGSK